MRGFSFESFLISESNRAAFEACRHVATLSYTERRPLLLVGPGASGKSHLLWAIVKEVRAAASRTGLALVLAREFPDKVRRLADDPGPIASDRPAILLVDDLQDFGPDAPDLERVVRVFLHHGHNVVLASTQPPNRLHDYSDVFRVLLAEGEVLHLAPVAGENLAAQEQIDAAQGELRALRLERDLLEQRLAEKTAAAAEAQSLRAEAERLLRENAKLEMELADRTQVAASQSGKDQQLARLQEAITRLEAERATLMRERDDLEQRLAQRAVNENELNSLRTELTHLRQQSEQERTDSEARWAEERQALEAEISAIVDQAHARFSEAEESWREERRALEEQVRAALQEAEAALDEAMARAREAAAAAGWQEKAAALQEQLDAAEQRFLVLRDERDSILDELRANQGTSDSHRFELEKANRQLALMAAEMDALRQEAAAQVANANLQAGELEARVARLLEVQDWLVNLGHASAHHAAGVRDRFLSGLEELHEASQRWADVERALREETAGLVAPEDGILFQPDDEQDFLERALWLDFEAPQQDHTPRQEPLQ